MESGYQTQIDQRPYRNRNFSIENLTPKLRWDERARIEKEIEEQLYDVFRKYVAD